MKELHIDSITKSYDSKVILSDVFLKCKIGEIHGLIGRNGSGKSTLLKIVFGTEKSETKFVRVGEKVIRTLSEGRDLINYLPQDNFLPNNAKIRTLIKLFLDPSNSELVCENEYVKPLLDKKNQHLSGGEKRILEILLIIHSKAKFILLDEPFNGVSPIICEYIIDYILQMKSSKGFIITDHAYENVIKVADELHFLNKGFLKKIDDKANLVELGYMSMATYNAIYKE